MPAKHTRIHPKISFAGLLCANEVVMLAATQLMWVFIHNLAQVLLRTGIMGEHVVGYKNLSHSTKIIPDKESRVTAEKGK